jgi:hypothetical protein
MTDLWIRLVGTLFLLVFIWTSFLKDAEATLLQSAKHDEVKAKALPTFKGILDWLPPDTETLVVTNGHYKLEFEAEDSPRATPLPLEKSLERLSYLPLGNIRKGVYVKKLAGSEVALAVEGARKFQAGGLGLSPYEGCHVLVFSRINLAGDSLRKALSKDSKRVQRLDGHEVYCFEEKLEDHLWKYYIAMPKPNILLCATDQGYLEEVLHRMVRKVGVRAFPNDIPEWKHVDTTKRFWAIRHYGKNGFNNNDSPELNDPRAVGLVFTFDPGVKPGGKRMPKVKYLSANKNARKIASKAWTYFDKPTWRPTVEQKGAGVVDITAELNDRQAAEFLFLLLFHLGHAIGA